MGNREGAIAEPRMSVSFVLRPEAELDIAEARGWYDEQRPGLGDEFVEAVEKAFQRIRDFPTDSRRHVWRSPFAGVALPNLRVAST